ncbi:MAG TPA: 30S ribosome-binding factor RbfA [Mycobacteriales bacterium]|nr:30S ribosome-binding factor RbfA [Mycobacteriales bacterium]
MVDVARARKLAVRIREVVASTLELQVKDPRLGMVTITDAKVTPDLREATLYYTVYGSDDERQSSAMALESAKGVLRTAVGRQTGVRYTPSLTFVADVVPETAGRIDELLQQARQADAQVQALAESAEPAGEPDPYRAPRAAGDETDEPGHEVDPRP